MNKSRRNKGFTVIEIMIVVAVIALLAIALLPNLTGARTSANISAIQSVLTRASQAQEMYYARCDSYYKEPGAECHTQTSTGTESASHVWENIVQFNTTSNIPVVWSSANTANFCVQAAHSSDPTNIYSVRLGQEPRRGAC